MSQHCITFYRKSSPEHRQTLTVSSGTRLHEAAVQAGVALRAHCAGAGTCGKCLAIVNRQKVLACQTVIESDLVVLVPDTSLHDKEQEVVIQVGRAGDVSLPVENEAGLSRRQACTRCSYGIAIDIGTTTLAAELHDLSGTLPALIAARPNPQRKFGEDVISRIQKVMENPSALAEMQALIAGTINEMVTELADKSGITPQDISTIVAAGNTVMQSLLFGIDPSPLGQSPFCAPVSEFPKCRGSELGITMSAEGTVEALPIFGGFVGGDIVAGILTLPLLHGHNSEILRSPCAQRLKSGLTAGDAKGTMSSLSTISRSNTALRLLLDIGTNGEIVLAHHGKLFTAATAAGPAFEGAKIECGTLAVPGAIDRVDVHAGKIVVSTIAGKPAVGICGSGLIDAAAALLELGIILPSGRFADQKPCFELVPATESGIGEAIVLTQQDIRELQLASGAIKAGMTLLLREHDLFPEEIETFYIAGGFGQSIRTASAIRIGLLPALPMERFRFCGNTSLAGASMVLLNPDNADHARRLVRQSHHCELSALPRFQEIFAESMRW